MKKIILLGIIMLLNLGYTRAQTVFKVNQYNVIYKGQHMPIMTLFTNNDVGNRWAFTNYFYINASEKGSWGEGLIGPTYSATKWLNISLLGGLQTNEKHIFRGGPVITVNKGKFSFFSALEFGGIRYRWDIMAFYVMPSFKIGGELIRNYNMFATGPRGEFTFCKKQPLTIFYTALWDYTYGNYAHMFGLYSAFPKKK